MKSLSVTLYDLAFAAMFFSFTLCLVITTENSKCLCIPFMTEQFDVSTGVIGCFSARSEFLSIAP